jgi:hypothetical protein
VGPVAHFDLSLFGELPIEDHKDIVIPYPLVLLHELELLVLPFHDVTVVLSLFHFESLQLDKVLHFLKSVSHVVGLRYIHAESKCFEGSSAADVNVLMVSGGFLGGKSGFIVTYFCEFQVDRSIRDPFELVDQILICVLD